MPELPYGRPWSRSRETAGEARPEIDPYVSSVGDRTCARRGEVNGDDSVDCVGV